MDRVQEKIGAERVLKRSAVRKSVFVQAAAGAGVAVWRRFIATAVSNQSSGSSGCFRYDDEDIEESKDRS